MWHEKYYTKEKLEDRLKLHQILTAPCCNCLHFRPQLVPNGDNFKICCCFATHMLPSFDCFEAREDIPVKQLVPCQCGREGCNKQVTEGNKYYAGHYPRQQQSKEKIAKRPEPTTSKQVYELIKAGHDLKKIPATFDKAESLLEEYGVVIDTNSEIQAGKTVNSPINTYKVLREEPIELEDIEIDYDDFEDDDAAYLEEEEQKFAPSVSDIMNRQLESAQPKLTQAPEGVRIKRYNAEGELIPEDE